MKFILKILLAPLMLILWVIECVCKLAINLSSFVLTIVAVLFVIASVFYFIDGNTKNCLLGLVVAFLFSPYGLTLLAAKILARFIYLRLILKEKVYE